MLSLVSYDEEDEEEEEDDNRIGGEVSPSDAAVAPVADTVKQFLQHITNHVAHLYPSVNWTLPLRKADTDAHTAHTIQLVKQQCKELETRLVALAASLPAVSDLSKLLIQLQTRREDFENEQLSVSYFQQKLQQIDEELCKEHSLPTVQPSPPTATSTAMMSPFERFLKAIPPPPPLSASLPTDTVASELTEVEASVKKKRKIAGASFSKKIGSLVAKWEQKREELSPSAPASAPPPFSLDNANCEPVGRR